MKKITIITLAVLLSACVQKNDSTKAEPTHQQAFFTNLTSLCGQVFEGASTFPDDAEHDFAGRLLVANFDSCNDNEIRVKFVVGEDHSRTWVISQSTQGLLLKHDHRHEDGTPDEVTNYGGWANPKGTPWQQHFEADDETAQLIPEAATNVWMLDYNPNTQVLTYDLKRHDLPRYQAQLKPRN